MTFLLVIYLMSSGIHYETFNTLADCREHMIEYVSVAGADVWSAACVDEDDNAERIMLGGIGP